MSAISNAFEGLEGSSALNLDLTEKMKIAIVGKQKSGKSWFAATAPPPVRIYDWDDRAASLAILPAALRANINVITLKDKSQAQPEAMQKLEAELSMLKYRKSKGLIIPASYVFDTFTFMKRAMENELMKQMGAAVYREVKVTNTTKIKISQSWDVVNGVTEYCNYLITEYNEFGNVIFVFHERPEKDVVESTDKVIKYTSQYTIDPPFMAKLLSKFNDIFRIQYTAAQRFDVTCKQTYEFNAATTLLLDQTEPPSITQMLAKHRSNLAKQQALKK